MTSTEYHSAEEKERVFKKFQKFFKDGCPRSGFTKLLYSYASNMFGHIAHYDLNGYYETWFASPRGISEWMDWALKATVFGDPQYCFSDVERELQVWIRESKILDQYVKQANDYVEGIERAELARLQKKYGVIA